MNVNELKDDIYEKYLTLKKGYEVKVTVGNKKEEQQARQLLVDLKRNRQMQQRMKWNSKGH